MATHNGLRHNGESPSTILTQLVAVDGTTLGFVQDSEVSTFSRTILDETDGRNWAKAAGLWYPLQSSAVAASCPADTTEDVLATVTIPAGSMGANGWLRMMGFWSFTNNGNNKTVRVRLGGVSGTVLLQYVFTTHINMRAMLEIGNANSQSSQVGTLSYSTSSGATQSAKNTAAIDTSSATTLVFTGQKASSGDTLTLESYLVELLYAA